MIRLVALLLCLCSISSNAFDWNEHTDLDNYVNSNDGYYSYVELAHYSYAGVELYVVNMTSQKWQDESFVTKSIWWHLMGIAIPHEIRHADAGFLFIDGGSNREDTEIPPAASSENVIISKAAKDLGIVGAYIKQVPNQPVVFSNDPSQMSRSEDSIIAWTWRTFADTPEAERDPTVVLRMPMTKAAKRGLDTIHDVAKAYVPSTHIDRFFVAGASKRGWTTWSIACTDQRVVGIAPMVFSMINIPETAMKHFQDMDGAWSFAFTPYYRENLTQELFNPDIDSLWDIEDMYRYRERLDNTYKIEMVSSGDEFFLCDDSHAWWDGMPGPKWMMMIQNSEHSMAPHYLMIYETAVSFITSILDGVTLPSVTWTMSESSGGGLIVIDTVPQPRNITAWSATTLSNDTRRDFRLASLNDEGDVALHPVIWRQDVPVVDFGDGRQSGASAEKVDGEWRGFFIQGTWEGPAPHYYRLVLTTEVNVIPYTYPHGPCSDEPSCWGYLV